MKITTCKDDRYITNLSSLRDGKLSTAKEFITQQVQDVDAMRATRQTATLTAQRTAQTLGKYASRRKQLSDSPSAHLCEDDIAVDGSEALGQQPAVLAEFEEL